MDSTASSSSGAEASPQQNKSVGNSTARSSSGAEPSSQQKGSVKNSTASSSSGAEPSSRQKGSNKKRKSFNVVEHFDEVKDSKGTKFGMRCRFPECNVVLTYESTYNLERHLIGKHQKLAMEVGLIKECPKKLLKLVVLVDVQEFLRNCVEIVTVCHFPFNIYAKKCFRGLLDPKATKLPIPALTPSNVSILCESVEQIFIDLIKNEVNGNLVSLKLDLATRHGRSMIGVNLQLIINGELITRTLGLIETTDRHTVKYIEKEIMQHLDKFSIKITQLYSTTTDSGSNVLKFVKLMINGQEMEFCQDAKEEMITMDELGEEDIASDEIPEDTSDELFFELDSILRSVKCGAHVLNLVVVEAISGENIKAIIAQVRDLVKMLRSEPYKQSFKANKKRLPFFDCTTRWDFTYLMMINCIIENQQFITEILPDSLNQKFDKLFWDNYHVIHDILKPVYIVTKKVQDHAILYGDFYIMWKELSLELQEIDDDLARGLLVAMDKREPGCFNNDAFWAAALLDRRINYNGTPFLSEDQQKRGMEHLLKTWKALTGMKGYVEPTCSSSEGSSTLTLPSGKISRLEQLLQHNKTPKALISCADITYQLRKFSVLERLPLDTHILHWWEENKHDYPNLYRLASVALAVPCTQVSVERAFSGFGQVLTPARTKIGKDKLEMVLFIKLNADLFWTYDVNIQNVAVNELNQ